MTGRLDGNSTSNPSLGQGLWGVSLGVNQGDHGVTGANRAGKPVTEMTGKTGGRIMKPPPERKVMELRESEASFQDYEASFQ